MTLKLHSLEISGFKSFVDPVSLPFHGGITAVVGPNGCGKSNLAEAITWVLGEQSAKSLRSGSMEDVIFNGAESRRALGLAEVTLTLLTDPGFPHSEDGRVVIGRRVFRGGEGQYQLNGKTVRLKEIKDLLMDTGLGLRAYSVIEQGRIGMILSGKPQDRRKLLEEAAGITRYKARKRVAEIKLEEAQANLLRLNDIITEVERTLRSLKRQANAASRFTERQAAYNNVLETVLMARWSRLHAQLESLRLQIEAAGAREAEITALLHRDEASLAGGRADLDTLGEELAARHRREAELAAAIEGRQEFLKGTRQTLAEIDQRAASGQALAGERQQEVEESRESLERLKSRRQQLWSERDQAAAAVVEDTEKINTVQEDLQRAESRLEDLRRRLLVSLGEVTSLRNRLHRQQIESEKGSYRRQHVGQELEELSTELDAAALALEQAQGRVAGLESRLGERAGALEELSRQLDETLSRESQSREQRRQLQEAQSLAHQRREVLIELGEAHDERRATLREALAAAGLEDPQFLSERLQVPGGWEQSLDLYLDRLGDAIVLDARREPVELARALARSRVSVTVVAPHQSQSAAEPIHDSAIIGSLGEALGLPPELASALPPAYLVQRAEDAERLARSSPGVAFISRDRLWAQSGVLQAQGEEGHPGVLTRERELQALAERIPELQQELLRSESVLERLVGDRTRCTTDKRHLEEEIAALREELAVAQARQQDAAVRHQRLTVDRNTLNHEQEEIHRELNRVAAHQQELEAQLTQAQERHATLEESFDRTQKEVEASRSERESLVTAGADRRGRLDVLTERVEAQDLEAARLQKEIEQRLQQVAAWEEEARSLAGRRQELERAMDEAEIELQKALEQRAVAQREVADDHQRLDQRRQGVQALEQSVQQHRDQRDQVRTEIEELRISQASLRQDGEHLQQTYLEDFGRPLPTIPEEVDESLDLAELEDELASRKDTLEKMGPVNVLAAKEYSEQQERHAFLTEQRADVASSVESLRKTIREINQTSGQRFIDTFHQVNRHFGETFKQLFRGGEAEMRLLDEDDLLDTGIEIVARPPGKRLQNIMLLSGGEKALTAIALLFALFRTKPSPFCILDEVDAPLDDANILRFLQVLKEMARETQFLIITHNKLTMEVAGTMHGVTMEEKGVSKLVAVELDQFYPEEEAAASA